MSWQQIQALVWLRYRIGLNQMKRSGVASAVVLALLMLLGGLLAVGLFCGGLAIGWRALSAASAETILLVWDGAVVLFLLGWAVALLVDLQRSDPLTLDKLLHLPVSPAGAFAINYLGSLVSPTLLIAGAALAGLSLGLIVGRGAAMLWLVPLLGAFVLMVTAVTSQFQGWLAALMANKRRRGMILVLISLGFVLITQAPNLVMQLWLNKSTAALQRMGDEYAELDRAWAAHEITPEEYERRSAELNRKYHLEETETHSELPKMEREIWLVNLVLPPGWLPLGAQAAAEGQVVPPLLCVLGMTLIGSASLWRSYRTTLAIYLGKYSAGRRRATEAPRRLPAANAGTAAGAPPVTDTAPATDKAPVARGEPAAPSWLEGVRFSWLTDEAVGVAVCTFRSLLRAPQVRMLLLSPLFVVVAFAPSFTRKSPATTDAPWMAFAILTIFLATLGQLVSNQFGFDRSGFQAFVLSGARRRDILLGKNLAVVPFVVGFGVPAAVIVQLLRPLPILDFLALLLQFATMFWLFCLVGNWASIMGPTAVPAGTFRRPKPTGVAMGVQLASMFLLFPLIAAAAWVPVGAQMLARHFGPTAGWPVNLLLSLAECVVAAFVYDRGLGTLGALLERHEQAILLAVKSPAE